jgi:hypothetical protein
MKSSGAKRGAADRLMAIAGMFLHNREVATSQSPRPGDCLGRFSAGGVAQGQRPSLVSIAKQIAVENRIAESTVWKWYCRFIKGGYTALGRRLRADTGRSALLHKRPELLRAIDVRLSAGMSPLAVWKSLRWACGLAAPSYEVVLNYARGRYRPEGESSAGGRPESRAL